MRDEKRKQSRKGAGDLIVDKVACHKHATLPKLNSPTMPPRNHYQSKVTKTKVCSETPFNRDSHHIEAQKPIRHASTQYKSLPKSISEQTQKIVSKFLVHKRSLPNQNQNYTLKR